MHCRPKLGQAKEYYHLLRNMDFATRDRLLEGIRTVSSNPIDPRFQLYSPHGFQPCLALKAAVAADQAFKGRGDYKNVALHEAVALLLFIYDVGTGSLPRFSKSPTGPVARGGQRLIGTTPCVRFLNAFFALVDPAVRLTEISSAAELHLAFARKQKRAGVQDYYGVVNLSDRMRTSAHP